MPTPVGVTARLGISDWDAGTDPLRRADAQASFQALEAKVGIYLSGAGLPPAPGTANTRAFYLNTNTGILYFRGEGVTSWVALNAFAAPSAQLPGDSITEGVAITFARSDHKHSLPAWGVVGELNAVGTVAAAGSTAKFARIDHTHILAAGAVTAGKIAAGGVSATDQIADGIITGAKIVDGTITASDLATDQQFQTGMMMIWPAASTPTGWLLCQGQSVATASYSSLFALIGYTYGGAGANFNLPDMRGRVPLGSGTGSGLTARSLGATGGAETVALDSTLIPAHTHAISAHSHGGSVSSVSVDHTHGMSFNTSSTSVSHTHNIVGSASLDGSHNHDSGTLTTGGVSYNHYHVPSNGGQFVVTGGGTSAGVGSGTGFALASTTGYEVGDHAHAVNSGYTGLGGSHTHSVIGSTSSETSTAHVHSVTGSTNSVSTTAHAHVITPEALTTQPTGTGTAPTHANMQPWVAVNFIIKT